MLDDSEQDRCLAELMARAQEGDGAAYGELLRLVTPRLRRAVKHRRRLEPCDVEDLVQDILLSLHAARATYDPTRPFMPWLLAIARNRIADWARRHARGAANEVANGELPETFALVSANRLIESFGEESFGDGEALARALANLPPGQRRAVELTKLKELSLKEAAAASGMTVSALKVAVHRAMGALRRALGTKA
ncbi:MAG TPA: sigma-70 family RNA polymerase sigma factor [Hyphomicrobiaceae bacterium]|nr:sigma-70 family RNA polymerase sigma factor [Hyphomicrobiaceae bacterium]